MTPLVTIGIPTYNGAHRIERAIASAVAQTHERVEVVVSDNASTDGTADVLTAWTARDPRVRWVRQPTNLGAVGNYEFVLREARGEYFMWLGDDDHLDPDYVASCVASLQEPNTTLVAGSAIYYREGHPPTPGQALSLEGADPCERVLEYFQRVEDNGIFYGVSRTADRKAAPWPRAMGSDWFVVAALVFRGRARTLPATHVHRTDTWDRTRGPARAARTLGVSSWHGRYPMAAIAVAALREIAASPTYTSLPASDRMRLAAGSALRIARRGRWPGPARRIARFMRGAIA